MGTRTIFSSLAKPNLRYVIYSSWSDVPCNTDRAFNDRITCFDTYGDGNVQHCHEWAPQNTELVDVLESLAVYLHELSQVVSTVDSNLPKQPKNLDEALKAVHTIWPPETSIDAGLIRFAASIQYKEGGIRKYYSVEQCKISASESKRHDKRYSQLDTHCDGSFQAVMCLLHEYRQSCGLLAAIARGWQVSEVVERFDRDDVRTWLKWDHTEWRAFRAPFEAIDNFVRGWERTDMANRQVECMLHNRQNRIDRAGRMEQDVA